MKFFGNKKEKELVTEQVQENNNTEKKENTIDKVNMSFYRFFGTVQNSNFIENENRLKTKIITVLLIMNIILGSVLAYKIFSGEKIYYFSVSSDMKVQQMKPLNEPLVTDNSVKDWLVRAITDTLALDYRTYRQKILDSRQYYEGTAHTSLVKSMQQGNIISLVRNNRLICSPEINKAPILLKKAVNSKNKYEWLFELEVKLTYESAKGIENVQYLIAKIIVQRVNSSDYPMGINIKQIIFRENDAKE